MPFDSGTITFRICHLPEALPKDCLERFSEKAAKSLSQVKDEPQWGWVSARHLLESRIDEQTGMLGGFLTLCLRQAERKIPSALLTAECRMSELAQMAADEVERLSRKQRKTIKEEVMERMLPNMPPHISGTYFAVDAAESLLYVTATSTKQLDMFLSLFCKTVGFEPIPLVPETVASEMFDIDPNSIMPYNISPALGENDAAGTLGQNFLTWLWFFLEDHDGVLPQTKLGDFSLMLDGPMTFIAEGQGSFETVVRKGLPTISAEAKAALTVGKKLRQAKLILARSRGEEWSVSLDADEFIFRSLKLPDGEAMDPGSVFEERMTNLYVFQKVFFALFQRFLNDQKDQGKRDAFIKRAKLWVNDRDGK